MELSKIFDRYCITDDVVKSKIEENYNKFQSIIDVKDNTDILWDATAKKYYENVNKLKMSLSTEYFKSFFKNEYFAKLDNFMDMCRNAEFQIAFVGAIKAGKSTLINALLGQNLASTDVTPETAALTKFKASKGKNYVEIHFYTSKGWNELWESVKKDKAEVFLEEYNNLGGDAEKDKWINKESIKIEIDNLKELKKEVKKWTSSKVVTHYFVKEVIVGLANSHIPENVVYVDTPGLDDPVKYRSDITRDYIDRANAVLVCVKSDSLTGGELKTIFNVFTNSRFNPSKIYILGTQVDGLNKPIEDWMKQREVWISHLEKDSCFGSKALADTNTIGTAAYLYNLSSKYDNLTEDEKDYELGSIAIKLRIREIEQNLENLENLSEIPKLKLKLKNEVVDKYSQILLNDISNNYATIKENLTNTLNELKKGQEKLLEATNASLDSIQEQIVESKKIADEVEKDKHELEKALNQIKYLTEERAKDLFEQIKKMGRK